MTTKEQSKQTILTLLHATPDGLTLPQLLQHLGSHYTERTVRRWLSELNQTGLVNKTGHKRGTRYFLAPIIKHSTEQPLILTLPFSESNNHIVQQIKRPLLARPPISYQKQWLNDYTPNQTSYLNKKYCEQMAMHGTRQSQEAPAGTYIHKIYQRLLIDLSYNSSRLEGNTYSLSDTQKLILSDQTNQDKLNEEAIMILNHKEAIRYLVDKAILLPLDSPIITTLHYLLSDGLVPTQYSGKVRDHGVRLSASSYIPIDGVERLSSLLDTICHKAKLITDPYEQSFFLLVQIAYLQAFTDVNKRTSRLAANIPLIRHNLVPLSFNDVDKDDYLSAMIAIYELNNIEPLAELYIYSYLRTCQQYDVSIEAFDFDEIRVRYRRQRREMIQHIVKKKLKGKALDVYIRQAIAKTISAEDSEAVHHDLMDDLRQLSPERIVGIGISQEELVIWQKLTRFDEKI